MSKATIISGGIASGKTRTQVEQFCEQYPEWAELVHSISTRYQAIRVGKRFLSVDFAEPHWKLTVHPISPGAEYWVAEIHDRDEFKRHPGKYIGPMAHVEDPDRMVAVRNALISARTQALDAVDKGIQGDKKKECDNPLCYREVDVGVMYCCKACGDAHEGGYKLGPPGFWPGVLTHSPMCDRRAYEAEWTTEVSGPPGSGLTT